MRTCALTSCVPSLLPLRLHLRCIAFACAACSSCNRRYGSRCERCCVVITVCVRLVTRNLAWLCAVQTTALACSVGAFGRAISCAAGARRLSAIRWDLMLLLFSFRCSLACSCNRLRR
jgi:hypothetical protein